MMTVPRFSIAFALMSAGLLCESGAVGLPANQTTPSKSDADINAIGRRDVGKGLDFYTLEHEKGLGMQLARQVEDSAKLVDDPYIASYVDRVGQRIARNSDVRLPVDFRVIDADAETAFTLPGGYQYINRGLLLRLDSEAELAGVLAHGIAHTALRSATKRATKADITQLAMIPAMIQLPDQWPVNTPFRTTGGNSVFPLTLLQSTREDELAADYFGLQYVYVTGYDPESYINLIQRIWPQTASNVPKVFSTSPPLSERIAFMRKEITEILPKRNDAVVSTPEFTVFQEHIRAWKPRD